MRRLTEILAFPKAWYRRSIVRRLFLGDLSSSTAYSEGDGSPPLNQEEAIMGSSLLKHYDRHTCDALSKSAPERSPILNREKLKLTLENDMPRPTRLKGTYFPIRAVSKGKLKPYIKCCFYIRYWKRMEFYHRQTNVIIRNQIKRIGMGDVGVICSEFYTFKRSHEYG